MHTLFFVVHADGTSSFTFGRANAKGPRARHGGDVLTTGWAIARSRCENTPRRARADPPQIQGWQAGGARAPSLRIDTPGPRPRSSEAGVVGSLHQVRAESKSEPYATPGRTRCRSRGPRNAVVDISPIPSAASAALLSASSPTPHIRRSSHQRHQAGRPAHFWRYAAARVVCAPWQPEAQAAQCPYARHQYATRPDGVRGS